MCESIFSLDDYINNLETIVNIDSGSEDLAGCGRMIQWFADKYEAAGFEVKIHEEEGKHPMMEARYSPNGGDSIDLLLMGHLDTVFPEGTAEKRPFSIENGIAHGPGSADMKSGALLAFYVAEALAKTGMNINICAALNSDEETGSEDSAEWICNLGAHARYCFNFEGGRPGGAFVKQRKGVYDYNIEFNGIAAHAGIEPEKGASAIVEMARWIKAIAQLNAPERGTTLNTGIVKGGTASNVVAEHASMIVELRFLTELEKNRIEDCFDKLASEPEVKGVKTSWHIGSGFPPMSPDANTEKLMAVMESAAKQLNQEKPEFAFTGGGSDANHLGNLPVVTIDGCGPEGGDYHSEKEYMVIESVESRYKLLIETVKQLF